jgi:hypothetical protein
MKGTNTLTLNWATMQEIIQEYLDNHFPEMNSEVTGLEYNAAKYVYAVTLKERDEPFFKRISKAQY